MAQAARKETCVWIVATLHCALPGIHHLPINSSVSPSESGNLVTGHELNCRFVPGDKQTNPKSRLQNDMTLLLQNVLFNWIVRDFAVVLSVAVGTKPEQILNPFYRVTDRRTSSGQSWT